MVFKLILKCHILVLQNLCRIFPCEPWVTINKTLPNMLKSFLNYSGKRIVKLFKNANSINTFIQKRNCHDDKGTVN